MSSMNENLPFCAQHRSEKEFFMEILCFSAQINNSLPQNVFFAPKKFFDVMKKAEAEKKRKMWYNKAEASGSMYSILGNLWFILHFSPFVYIWKRTDSAKALFLLSL